MMNPISNKDVVKVVIVALIFSTTAAILITWWILVINGRISEGTLATPLYMIFASSTIIIFPACSMYISRKLFW